MRIYKNGISDFLLLLACTGLTIPGLKASNSRAVDAPVSVQNVILFIGDGMGIHTVDAARFHRGGSSGKLQMDRMPVTGLVRTCPADKLVTDSAASATALATGRKTKNGMLGMTPDGNKWTTLLEACKARGMACGLVATSSITHATPAAFASHIDSRRGQPEIAAQLLEHGVDVLLGGGIDFFKPRSAENSKRKDDRDLLAEARARGYEVALTRDAMTASRSPLLLGLFAREGMKTLPPEPSLAEMSVKAVGLLSARAGGFFLMVEGSQIDWEAHDNETDETIRQVLDFDAAVGLALDFAASDGRTLVLVTADHETGGASVTNGRIDGSMVKVKWNVRNHTADSVLLLASGPGADAFTGFQENTEIAKKTARLLNIEPFPVLLNP
jgi:alkaline phosphatase